LVEQSVKTMVLLKEMRSAQLVRASGQHSASKWAHHSETQ
jgi:hypothetical protein